MGPRCKDFPCEELTIPGGSKIRFIIIPESDPEGKRQGIASGLIYAGEIPDEDKFYTPGTILIRQELTKMDDWRARRVELLICTYALMVNNIKGWHSYKTVGGNIVERIEKALSGEGEAECV